MSAGALPRSVDGEVMRPESCDPEIADMMAKLSKLQSWLVIQGCRQNGDPAFMAASSLIQDVRVLLVERCFTPSPNLSHGSLPMEDYDER